MRDLVLLLLTVVVVLTVGCIADNSKTSYGLKPAVSGITSTTVEVKSATIPEANKDTTTAIHVTASNAATTISSTATIAASTSTSTTIMPAASSTIPATTSTTTSITTASTTTILSTTTTTTISSKTSTTTTSTTIITTTSTTSTPTSMTASTSTTITPTTTSTQKKTTTTDTPTTTLKISKDSDIIISAVQFDAPGDDRTKENLNGEWVEISNSRYSDVDLAGWTLNDDGNHAYNFPSGFKIKSGNSVKIHTGSGADTESDLYWNSGRPVWNNDGDTATLKDKGGKVIDSFSK